MKQFVLAEATGPDGLRMVERERPQPGPHEVLVRLHAASLNRRDLSVVRGRYGLAPLKPDLVPLSDGAGEVVAIGPGVTRVKEGQRVAGTFTQNWLGGELTDEARRTVLGGSLDGVLAEYRVFDEEGLVHVPEHLSYEEAATLPCAALTAWHALFEQKPLQVGNTVLIQGTGGVSIFALQLARLAGAIPIVISSSDEKLARARELGAAHTINYTREPEWGGPVRAVTGGRGVDLVVEVGGPGTLQRSLDAVRAGGHIAMLGVLMMGHQIDPAPFLAKGCSVKGLLTGPRDMFERMNRAVSAHRLKPVVDRVFSFAQSVEALRHLEGSGHFGKIVIRIAE